MTNNTDLTYARLATYVVLGDRALAIIHEECGLTTDATRDVFRQMIRTVGEDNLMRDPLLTTAFRIVVLRMMDHCRDPMINAPDYIVDFFSEELCKKLIAHALETLRNEKIVCAFILQEELRAFQGRIAALHDKNPHPLFRQFRFDRYFTPERAAQRGVETWVDTCAICGTKQRCDPKTKWFRCKCGKRSYPFESENPATT